MAQQRNAGPEPLKRAFSGPTRYDPKAESPELPDPALRAEAELSGPGLSPTSALPHSQARNSKDHGSGTFCRGLNNYTPKVCNTRPHLMGFRAMLSLRVWW